MPKPNIHQTQETHYTAFWDDGNGFRVTLELKNDLNDFPIVNVFSESAEGSEEVFSELTLDAVTTLIEMLELAVKEAGEKRG